MSLRTSLKRLAGRDPDAPSLRERAAGLRAGLARLKAHKPSQEADAGRRAVVGGALAAAVPLPALAAPAVVALPHPDADLLDLGARWLRTRTARDEAIEAWGLAWRQVCAIVVTCPPELFATRDEVLRVLGGGRRPTLPGLNFRHVYLDWKSPEARTEQAWTGEALRIAIAHAVSILGRGGLTPNRIRRWRALLPAADAFDARMEAVESASHYRPLEQARRGAEDEFDALNREISGRVAATTEGMAVLVRVIGLYPWKDTGGAWPNLLRSAAYVGGLDPSDLDHAHDTVRRLDA